MPQLIYTFWRDWYRESLIAMAYRQVDSSSFMGWKPEGGIGDVPAQFVGC